jgi:thioester reductase-like protein
MSVKDESEIETVLLTGVTGILGPYLLKELSLRPTIKRIICLIRKREKVSAHERLIKRLKVVDLEDQVDLTKVECIEGDITDEIFGLSQKEFNHLAGSIDAIVNSAVRVDHTAKYYNAPESNKLDIRTVNVKGTVRLLEFAVHSKLKYVYHAGTYGSVFSTNEDGCLLEEWQDPGVFDQFSFNWGYLLSKHISEQLVRQAGERGIPSKTFRLSSLGGDSRSGRFDYLNNHMAMRWLAYLKLKCMPDLLTPLVIIPVDHVARISLDLFFDPRVSTGDILNIFPPQGGVDQTFIEIAEEFGTNIELVSLSEFVAKLKLERDDSPLALFKKMYEDEEGTFNENMEESSPTFHFYQKYIENGANFYRSRKLTQLMPDYDELESTEVVMRRDVSYLKESGVFEKFGIR